MSKGNDVKLIAALLAVAFFWGTTFLGIRIAVHTVPPWYVTGIRQLIAAIIMLFILLYRKQLRWVGWNKFAEQALLSSLMLIVANGMTTVAEQSIPSGLTSLLSATTPIFVFVASVMVGLERTTWRSVIGVLIGFAGVAFIFRGGFDDLLDTHYLKGIFYLLIAIIGWTIGTIYTKKHIKPSQSLSLDLFYQFAFAGVVQLFLAYFLSPSNSFGNWSLVSVMAITYLGVFGSIVGYFSYHYALKKVSATKVSILSYFNTIIAIFLGWLILDEKVTSDLLIATVLIIIGVYITSYKNMDRKRKSVKT